MPRIAPRVIQHAAQISQHLPKLLRECRDLSSAVNELRWMKETILKSEFGIRHSSWTLADARTWSPASSAGQKLRNFVKRRARGEPLQYILGTQPFGELEILCRPNVLIPRWETEVYTSKIAQILQSRDQTYPLRIADICSGSGCIALLLHSVLKPPNISGYANQVVLRGYDISEHALRLARDNLRHSVHLCHLHKSAAEDIEFKQINLLTLAQKSRDSIRSHLAGDVAHERHSTPARVFDVIVSNPPYISPRHYAPGGTTSKSVRKFEPKLALVPPASLVYTSVDGADQFYVALLRVAVATKVKLLVVEVGDDEQAFRVKELYLNMHHLVERCPSEDKPLIEFWKDDGSVVDLHEFSYARTITSSEEAECRAVVVWFDGTLRQY